MKPISEMRRVWKDWNKAAHVPAGLDDGNYEDLTNVLADSHAELIEWAERARKELLDFRNLIESEFSATRDELEKLLEELPE